MNDFTAISRGRSEHKDLFDIAHVNIESDEVSTPLLAALQHRNVILLNMYISIKNMCMWTYCAVMRAFPTFT